MVKTTDKLRTPHSLSVLRIHLFGPLRIDTAHGLEFTPRTRKARGLLAYLAVNDGEFVTRSKIAGLLWDRVPEAQARKSLRQALSELGTALSGQFAGAIESRRDEIRLTPELFSTDIQDLYENGPINPENYLTPLLDDLDGLSVSFDDWLFQERAVKAEMVRSWHEEQIARLSQSDEPSEACINAARALLAFDPAHERAWRTLMSGLAEIGDIGQAIREYDACKAALKRALDAEPSEETRALANRLRNHGSRTVTATETIAPFEPSIAAKKAEMFASPAHTHASIVVLPFAKLSNEPQINFIANGLLEGIIHVLSGIGDVFVIARGTALRYAGTESYPPEIHKELGVRYILSGTVSSFGSQSSVFAEMAEADTGRVIWTDRVRANVEDLFELQDEVCAKIVAAIAPSVRANDLARAQRKPPSSLSAYELLLQGLNKLYGLDQTKFDEAGANFRRAMRIDPGFAAVRSHAATWYNFRVNQGWAKDPTHDSGAAAELATQALSLDHNDAIALSIQGQVLSFTRRDYERAREFLDRAISVGPSCHLAWTLSSATCGWTGDGEGAIAHAKRAMTLSPFDPFAFFAEHMLSQGHYVSGDYENAILWGQRSAERNGRLASNLRTLSAAYVAAGEIGEAKRIADQVMQLDPKFSLDRFKARTPFHKDLREEHAGRLSTAGLPN